MDGYFLISISSKAAYVARFSVAYTEGGEQKSVDSGDFTSGATRTVNIPGDATTLCLKAEAEIFIDDWSTIFTEQWSSVPGSQVCYEVSGTTLDRHWQAVTCPS